MRAGLTWPSLLLFGSVAFLAGAAPAISIRFVGLRHLDQARDVWLLALGAVAAVATAVFVSWPLGLMAAAVVARWRSWEQLPAVATWAGIIATWALVRALPDEFLALVPWGWRALALALLGMAIAQRRRRFEVKAWLGSRTLLAALLVLVWPFTHPAEWPAYAVGLWLTSSWVALAALLVAIGVRYPETAWPLVGLTGLLLAAFSVPWTRRTILGRTPRGSSLKGLHMRLRTWRAMLRVSARWPVWLIGWGPPSAGRSDRGSLEHALTREAVLITVPGENRALATSPTHCEPLELACTYGVPAIIAMAGLGWELLMHMRPGDPWSAAALAGVVLSCATIPARAAPVGVVWLVTLAAVAGR